MLFIITASIENMNRNYEYNGIEDWKWRILGLTNAYNLYHDIL